jgi:hypothetical protein
MQPRKALHLRSQARRTLGSAVVLFAAAQLTLAIAIECWLPELRDPICGQKLRQLQTLAERSAQDRLVVMLGSSRTFHGFDAKAFETLARRNGEQIAVFNFGIPGGGPLTELLTLRRLLAAGIRPDAVLVEIMPALFVDAAMKQEAMQYPAARLWHNELPLVSRFLDPPANIQLKHEWLANWYAPSYTQRLPIERFCYPRFVPREGHEHLLVSFDAHGCAPIASALVKPEDCRRGLDIAQRSYEGRMGDFQTGALAGLVLDELLSLCGENRIAATLVLMPEGPTFRSWYSQAAWQEANRYTNELARRHCVWVVDARDWCEESGFLDSHHLLDTGAERFSRRLADARWTRSFDQLVAWRSPIHSP